MKPSPTPPMPDLCSRRHPVHITTALMLLKKAGVDLNRVDIIAVGRHENYLGEIREQQPSPGTEISPREKIVLKLGYDGAVDQLPYQFFYGLDSRTATRSDDWDDRARRLMAPFDAAVIRRMALAEFEELRHKQSFGDLKQITQFLSLFDFDTAGAVENLREGLLWSALMPSFNKWAGNPRMVERVLTCLFGYHFEIEENTPATFEIPSKLQYRLGSETDRLGRETVLGDSFTECDTGVTVVMKGVEPKDIGRFLPNQPGHRKLRQVLGICLPSHFTCKIRVEPNRKTAVLGGEPGAAYLGYNIFA